MPAVGSGATPAAPAAAAAATTAKPTPVPRPVTKKPSTSRRDELMKQLKAVEDAISKKRTKLDVPRKV